MWLAEYTFPTWPHQGVHHFTRHTSLTALIRTVDVQASLSHATKQLHITNPVICRVYFNPRNKIVGYANFTEEE